MFGWYRAGKQLVFVDTHALDQLAELLKRGCDIVDGCGRPGWLPRMALNEKTVDEFKYVQATALTILQACSCLLLDSPRFQWHRGKFLGPVMDCSCHVGIFTDAIFRFPSVLASHGHDPFP